MNGLLEKLKRITVILYLYKKLLNVVNKVILYEAILDQTLKFETTHWNDKHKSNKDYLDHQKII